MKHPFIRLSIKVLKITGISVVIVLLLLFLIPYFFPGFVSGKIKDLVNSSLTSKVNFSGTRLSFFNHFPSLTLTLTNFSLTGSQPFQNDTLVSAKEVSLGINLKSLLSGQVKVDEIYLSTADINVQVDSAGKANYNVYASKNSSSTQADTAGTSLKIEKILISNTNLVYNDRSLPMQIVAKGVNYEGTGDLNRAIFDLRTHMQIDSMDFYYGSRAYLQSKRINADLVTQINTNSLSFLFEKNDLKINELPVKFTGKFSFLKEGYAMYFKLTSAETNLRDIFSALPPGYTNWLQNTEIKGNANLDLSLSGNYVASTNTMPSLIFNSSIRDGYINNNHAPSPVKNLFLNFQSSLPGLNPDSLTVNIDSIYFNIENDYFSSIIRLKGITEPQVYAKINAAIDLEKWDRAIGIAPLDFKGKFDMHLLMHGKYATRLEKDGLRKVDTVISSIPSFTLHSSLQNGYFKYTSLPQAINNIGFTVSATCPDNNYSHIKFDIDSINANALDNFIKGYVHLQNGKRPVVNSLISSVFHLSEIKQFYPLDSVEINGDLYTNIQTKGKYYPPAKLFPVTKAVFSLHNASIKTKYYPHPITNIQVDATVTDNSGTLKGLKINVKPISFLFEGMPFILKANLQNFDNLAYNITSKGKIDLGGVYKVFSKKGYDVTGSIQTNLSLNGLQSDAMAGNYEKLLNKGTLVLKNVRLNADIFPNPFIIKAGVFRFNQDKIWFDSFKASYGKTAVQLKGYLSNVIDYAMQKNAPLKGNFSIASNHFFVDEFMAFANTGTTSSSNNASGVIIVPATLSMGFNATVNTVTYNGLNLKDFKGQMNIDSGKIKLSNTGFVIIDAPVTMDASYTNITPRKAVFDYHINVKEFDIQKAYNQIKLFRDMATSAAKAQGSVSLDYTISGRLDENMKPVYPSLKGGGVLSLKKVKVKGLKLFGAVSKATGKNNINDPDLSKVDIKTSISNNLITISRTKMRVAGFRPRFEGQVSFDGKLNLQFRLGLPPFGIIGIPMIITGNEEKPAIHFRKGKQTDELPEEEDKDDSQ
ncbi:MAG TPA: AsmA family protein [Chitinophagaceae bacterium]|nr:AsmA family protein [Chitinophagaceae bacterium]